MGISHLLQDFSAVLQGDDDLVAGLSLEEQRLESYEAGYKAGWQDAVKMQSEEGRRITSDLAENLSSLRFTYEDAMQGMLRELRPLFLAMTDRILPRLAQETLGAQVQEILAEAAAQQAGQPIEIAAAPGNLETIEKLCEGLTLDGVTLRPDADLGPGQVHFRIGRAERDLDTDRLLADINRAIAAYFDTTPAQQESA